MPRSQSSAVSRRRLRSALRKLRTAKDMTQKDVADALRWSPTKLMRIEMGKVGISYTDLQALLKQYGVTEPARIEELTDLASTARGSSVLSTKYKDALTPEFADFLEHEEEASLIRQFEPDTVPGPLQTREYATAVLATMPEQPLSAEVREQRVEARLERTTLLTTKGGVQAFFVIDESALHRRVGAESGDDDIMVNQLNYLKELGAYPNVTIQILPFSAGIYTALRSPFVVLEFDDEFDDGLVYIESPQDELIIREDLESIVRYIDRFQTLERKATAPGDLNAVIDRFLQRLKDEPSPLAGTAGQAR